MGIYSNNESGLQQEVDTTTFISQAGAILHGPPTDFLIEVLCKTNPDTATLASQFTGCNVAIIPSCAGRCVVIGTSRIA